MKLKNILFLFEDRVEFITDKFGTKLVDKAKQDLHNKEVPASFVVDELTKADPSKNKQYLQWIVNQYLKGQFRLEDTSRIKSELEQFSSLKNRLPEKDINKYNYYKLSDTIDSLINKVEFNNPQDEQPTDGIDILYDGPLGRLAIPLTQEASCELGRGTKWCTAARENNMFDEYADEGPLYVWKDKSGEKYQFHFESLQFMDDKDRPIHINKLNEFRTKHPVLSKLFKQKENQLLQTTTRDNFHKIVSYAKYVIQGRWLEAEPTILSHPKYIDAYVRDVIKTRWLEAEDRLSEATDDNLLYAINYAENILKKRWTQIEPNIIRNERWILRYAKDVIKGRWPEAEETLLNDANPEEVLKYAQHVIKGRWPEAEPIIKKWANTAVVYAIQILKDRWPEAERTIMNTPFAKETYNNFLETLKKGA